MSRNKELKQYAKELQKQKELKAQIEREAQAAAANRAGQIAAQRGADVGVSGGGRGSRRGDADISNNQRGGFATDDTAGFFARGGRVKKRRSYFNGGIVSLRRR